MLSEDFKKKFFIFIFLSIFIFSIFQLRIFFVEEKVSIKNFEHNDFLITQNETFILEGVANKSKKFYINEKEIFLNDRHEFSEKLYLFEHENIFNIKSISKTDIIFERKISIFFEK